LTWTPRWDGNFRIKVVNRGGVWNEYLLKTNLRRKGRAGRRRARGPTRARRAARLPGLSCIPLLQRS
jgi:hypothetical protein